MPVTRLKSKLPDILIAMLLPDICDMLRRADSPVCLLIRDAMLRIECMLLGIDEEQR